MKRFFRKLRGGERERSVFFGYTVWSRTYSGWGSIYCGQRITGCYATAMGRGEPEKARVPDAAPGPRRQRW